MTEKVEEIRVAKVKIVLYTGFQKIKKAIKFMVATLATERGFPFKEIIKTI